MGWSLRTKLATLLLALLVIAAASGALLAQTFGSAIVATAVIAAVGVLPTIWLSHRILRPLLHLLRAVSVAVANYRDGDFSLSLVVNRDDEFGDLLKTHNELGNALREQRSELTQRELLLDTITQNSPVALVLVDPHRRVAYTNLAARHLLGDGQTLVGRDFNEVLRHTPEPLRVATTAGEDALFAFERQGSEETFHLSTRSFLLQGRRHTLYLFKHMTRELSRQEVATWKKLIRILSHELNNSLAPISSLAHTGAEMANRGVTADLSVMFAAIGERAAHLHRFIQGYATLAKLPAPQPEWVEWSQLVDEVALHQRCRVAGPLPPQRGWFDRAQIGQALINLLKNASEAGGPPEDIELKVTQGELEHRIEVRDRGAGMSEHVMSQALLPFYSTKRSGTGLGLALAREIVEAHGGHIRLTNREHGGLSAMLVLPHRTDLSRHTGQHGE